MVIHDFTLVSVGVFQQHSMWRLHRCFLPCLVFLKTLLLPLCLFSFLFVLFGFFLGFLGFLNVYRTCALIFVLKKSHRTSLRTFSVV